MRTAAYVSAAIAPVALLPLVVRTNTNLQASDFGVLLGAYGVGAILSATLLLPRLRARFSLDTILAGAVIVSALSCVLLALFQDRITIAIVLVCAGAAWLASMTSFNTAIQMAVPNWVRARASALQLIVTQGSIALGAVLWGQATARGGLPAALWIAAAFLLLGLALVRPFSLDGISEMDLRPSDHWHGHQLVAEPQPCDGPVLVTIEYLIQIDEKPSFKRAMESLREIRLRDGAFSWDLFCSLDQQGVYYESFLVVSWAEHLRQHARAVVEDRKVEEIVLRYHQGPNPPVVRHYLREAPMKMV